MADRLELMSGHMGNGLVIWRKGEDMSIAHISPNREVSIYKNLTKQEYIELVYIASTDDRNISVTQDARVFLKRPITPEWESLDKAIIKD